MLGTITHIIFTVSVILIGVPGAIYLLKKSIEGFVKFGFGKLPQNYLLIDPDLGTYALKIFFGGLLLFIFVIWYLFFDKGGHLFLFINQIKGIFVF